MAIQNVALYSDYKEILKVLQEGTVTQLLHDEESFFKLITAKFNKADIEGKKIIMAAKDVLGHPAAAFIAYNGSFASRSKARYENITIEPKYVTAHLEMDRTEMELAKTDKSRFIDLWTDELESKNKVIAQQLSRTVFGYGDGALGTYASATIDVAPTPDEATVTLSTAATSKGSVYWFEPGDEIKWVDPATGTARVIGSAGGTKATIKSVDLDAGTFIAYCTNTAENIIATNMVVNDIIMRYSITWTGSSTVIDTASEEMVGFDGLIDDTTTQTLFGISRATTPLFKGQVKNLLGETLGINNLHTIAKKIGLQGGKPKMILSSFDSYIRLAELGQSLRHVITEPTLDITLGIETVRYASPTGGSIPIVNSRYCPTNRIYMIDPTTFEFRGQEPEFVEVNGEITRLKPSSSGGYENKVTGELFGIMALIVKNPSKNGKLTNFSNTEVE